MDMFYTAANSLIQKGRVTTRLKDEELVQLAVTGTVDDTAPADAAGTA
ncbi:hypothetical protein [Shewanella dokdonensis]|uniref:Uncharacterized protein n=1 Tax=Shewanella dokdonensis TaxID=712036 RepID=A0ABX8DCI2_9GAMM|nr:hypothetical protein [Shewanella dokdonensis]MCL1074503.1 hypothetical protein [Shewanella dokdonensis]QVK22463.1 hypothetical protein KHX94_14000 [Shewanella dokdonensis]